MTAIELKVIANGLTFLSNALEALATVESSNVEISFVINMIDNIIKYAETVVQKQQAALSAQPETTEK